VRRISHRELRNNSSEVLRSIENRGFSEITDYGRVVALLTPARQSRLDSLRAAGKTQAPTASPADLLRADPVVASGRSDTELDALRSDR
jgi:antitoxin (DNA-binding transcriptional repressor) of toxin-antitoxin stability system